MRVSIYVLLLLLGMFLHVHEAQGMRWRDESRRNGSNRFEEIEQEKSKRNEGVLEESILSQSSHSSGIARKLLNKETTSSSSDKTNQKTSTVETVVRHQQQPLFTDIVDIEGMDYSAAKRKPPIHN